MSVPVTLCLGQEWLIDLCSHGVECCRQLGKEQVLVTLGLAAESCGPGPVPHPCAAEAPPLLAGWQEV